MKPIRSLLAGLALAAAMTLPAAAQTGLAMRDRLVLISSGSSMAVTRVLANGFIDRYAGVTEPLIRSLPSTAALDLFCAGIGAQTPDIAIVVRRMARSMVETCQANGVRDVVELRLGLGAVVLAVRRGEPAPNLTTRQVWEALAAERVVAEEFVPNRTATWSDLAPGLPQTPIRFLMPPSGNGTTGLFEDMVLEGGCRDVKAVRLLFEAAYRRSKCITLREDGRVLLTEGVDLPAALLASPAATSWRWRWMACCRRRPPSSHRTMWRPAPSISTPSASTRGCGRASAWCAASANSSTRRWRNPPPARAVRWPSPGWCRLARRSARRSAGSPTT
jgi:phosphate transport system substrate-binding protein